MAKDSKSIILETIESRGQARPQDLVEILGITRAAVHRHLKNLVAQDLLQKMGSPPQVFYRRKAPPLLTTDYKELPEDLSSFLENRYLYISPEGHLLIGVQGFVDWATRTQQIHKLLPLAMEYQKVRLEADSHFDGGLWIDATHKFQTTFNKVFLKQIFYEDFYSLPKFGRTKKGQLVLHGKQAQKKPIIKQVIESSRPILKALLKKLKIEAVAWVPHSIPREVPFLKEYRKGLRIALPEVELVKAYAGEVPVAQKSLSKLEERIVNAESSFFLKEIDYNYKRILLIDDAVGSGATLNEIAKKIKKGTQVKEVYGFAIVGSLKGFEVLLEI